MKHLLTTLMLASAVACTTLTAQTKKIDAFPGAEGAGRYTTGGRGGAVYHVTSLADDGSEGTLRWAIGKKGARTIVFDVAGTIELQSVLKIQNGDVTIAGQTAPGDGICLKRHCLQVASNNVIVRYLRVRCGDDDSECEDDAISAFSGGNGLSNIIFDHCTASWSIDECLSCYGVKNLTVQWCYITESLYNSIHNKGAHGYGGIWGGCPATFHHNLIAHHSSRNPRLCGSRFNNDAASEMVDLRNNVFYNWGPTNGGYAGEGGCYNFINNAYKPGPMTATKSALCNRIFQASADDGTNSQAKGVWGTFHMSGNWFDTSCPDLTTAEITSAEKVNVDNWNGLHINSNPVALSGGKVTIESQTAFACASVTTHSAQDAMERVLEYGGCSKSRDAIDARIAYEVENGTYTYTGSKGGTLGLIDTPSDTEGYLTYTCTAAEKNALTDANNNGIPDNMEDLLFGGEVTANGHDKDADYTNLEYYLNYLVRKITEGELEGGTPSVDGTGDGNSSDDSATSQTEAFIATTTEVGGYDYYWFNADNADQVNAWISDGTISVTNGKFNKAFSNDNSEHTGALQLNSGTGEVVFKCPSIVQFELYLFRTGSFGGEVLTSTDGVNYNSVKTYSGSKYVLELNLTDDVFTSDSVYVKVTNTSSGTLSIQGAKIVKHATTTGLENVRLADGVLVAAGRVTAADALNLRAYNTSGVCVAAANGTELSLESLPRGIYTVRIVRNDGRIQVRKLIK
jgi:hypothetical protein